MTAGLFYLLVELCQVSRNCGHLAQKRPISCQVSQIQGHLAQKALNDCSGRRRLTSRL